MAELDRAHRARRAHAFRVARFDGTHFDGPRTVARGENWFVNWADVPSIAAGPNKTLAAQWLERNGDGKYAYGIRVRCSTDGGETWGQAFWLHRDRSPVEHGFVSMHAQPDGRFLAVWLDGRDLATTDDMALRAVTFNARGESDDERVLDPRVCECCPTAMIRSDDIDIVAYRGRSAEDGHGSGEIRDINIVRREIHKWSKPTRCHTDDWRTPY